MSQKKFSARLGADAGALFVEVPFDVKKEFGKARPPVKVSINGHSFPSTVAVYGGKYYLPVRKDRREAAGVQAGETVTVTVALDTDVRKVAPPRDLSVALARQASAKAQWEKLSYTQRKELADAVANAKRPETRARRVQKIVNDLVAMAKARSAAKAAGR